MRNTETSPPKILTLFDGVMVCLFSVLGYFCTLTQGFNMADESWFLQVVSRILSGETLYRDLSFGVTPLSIYLTELFLRIFGAELVVLKVVLTLCFAGTLFFACRIAKQLRLGKGFPFALATAILMYSPPPAAAPYQSLAHLFYLGCFSSVLGWRSQRGRVAHQDRAKLAMGGLLAGFCFSSKQNVGIYAGILICFSILGEAWSRRRGLQEMMKDLLAVSLPFAGITFLVLLPVVWSGGWEKFWEYGFASKGLYLRYSSLPYSQGLKELWNLLGRMASWQDFSYFYRQVAFLFPFFTLPALFWVWYRSSGDLRREAAIVLFFTIGAIINIFPRADYDHLIYAMPELLIGLMYAWNRINDRFPKALTRGAQCFLLVWLYAGWGVYFLGPVLKIVNGTLQMSPFPHFRWVYISSDMKNRIDFHRVALREKNQPDQGFFFLTPYAGFYYLLADIRNPTPFDYPIANEFGLRGEEEVAERIDRGEIRKVCLSHRNWSLTPTRLEDHVQKVMSPRENLGACILYESAAGLLTGDQPVETAGFFSGRSAERFQ